MHDEHIALVALLRARPDNLSWPRLTEQILEYGSARQVWDRYFPAQLLPLDDSDQQLHQAAADLERWQDAGLQFVSVLDDQFPIRLRDIVQVPPFLFAQGRLLPADDGVAVVGSRDASHRGLQIARSIAAYLVNTGLTVVSGLAAGIDTAAHVTALDAGARTVAFMGTGSLRTYPAANKDLHRRIADTGLVLSQFWPEAPPQKHTFLQRNALSSGYSLATIVCDAGEHSGARAQARMALEHGRPVILTDLVVEKTQWGKEFAERPSVSVASGTHDIAAFIGEIRQQSELADKALYALAQG